MNTVFTKRATAASVLMLVGVGLWILFAGPVALRHDLHVSRALSTPLNVAQLTEAADIVAVVQPTGHDRVHWNDAANLSWTSNDTRLPMIYNDQEVKIVQLLRGHTGQSITIRNIGGVVGDTSFEFEGLAALDPGSLYLVFLETVQTPTREGWEAAISFVGQEQGIFIPTSDGGYVNVFGQTASSKELGI